MRFSRLMLGLAATAVFLQLSGCKPPKADALSAAKARIAKNEDAAAEIDLKNYLQRQPTSGEARFLLGLQAQKRGDGQAALIEFQKALELKHPNAIVVPAIVNSLLTQGKFRQVIDEFQAITLTDVAANAELQALVAQAMQSEGDTRAAAALSDKAAAAAPAAEIVQLTKATFEAQAGRTDQAVAVLDSLLAKKPDSHLAWTMKGNVLGAVSGRRDAAMDAFRKALAIKPADLQARTGLISMSMQAGNIPAVEKELEVLRKQAPKHPNTLFYQANLAFAKGNYVEAQVLYQSVLRVLPQHSVVLLAAAANELKLNGTAQAESLLSKVLAQFPEDLQARQLLAQIYLRTGQPAKAISALSSQAESLDASPNTMALVAEAQLMNGNVVAADQLYGRMAKLNPSDPALRTLLATANLGKIDALLVYDSLEKISDGDKGTTADMALISARMRALQYDDAMKAVAKLIKKRPEQPLSYQLKAQVFFRQDNWVEAKKALELALTKDATYLPAVLGLAAIDLRNQKPDLAKQRVEDLVKKQPNNASALMALAELCAEFGMPSKVVLGYIERAIKVNPESPDAWLALIAQHARTGDMRASLAAAQASVTANPKSIPLLDSLGRAALRIGQTDLALSTFGKITSQYPKSLIGYLGHADAYAKTGNLAEANRNIGKVLERDPRNQKALALALSSALQQKRFKDAADVARKVQQQRPSDAIGTMMVAEVEASQGHTESAIALWSKALKQNGAGHAPIKLHAALSAAGKTRESDALAATWQKDHAEDLAFQGYLATVAREKGQLDQAANLWRQVLKKQPNHVATLNDLAMLLAQQGKGEAIPMAEQALKLSPENPAVMDTLAHALAAQKDWLKAVETQKRAVLLAPNEPALRLSLAQWELKTGNKAAAKRSLDGVESQASKLNATDRAAMAELAKALKPF